MNTSMRTRSMVLVALLAVLPAGCAREEAKKERTWTVSEIRALRGRTREEIVGLLGKPTGFYTMESRGRFHYPGMLIMKEGSPAPEKKGVIFYFSQLGDRRCTIVEIMDRWEASKEPKP